MSDLTGLIVVASGEADAYQPELFEARVRSTVRYADPAAWTTATAVALAVTGAEDLLAMWRHEIGIIAISDQGPGTSMAKVEADATTAFSSPLHYAASSPGTLAGVACIAFGLRGPTMNLTMSPRDGMATALMMCGSWLERKSAKFMVIATHGTRGTGAMMSRAVLLAPPGSMGAGEPLTESSISWLGLDGLVSDGAVA